MNEKDTVSVGSTTPKTEHERGYVYKSLKDLYSQDRPKYVRVVNKRLDEYTKRAFGGSFVFRQGQKETILQIVETYAANIQKYVILYAPTGSGKSIIATAIAYIIKHDTPSFILTSTIQLQKQYDDMSNTSICNDMVTLLGKDNYFCPKNKERLSCGLCVVSPPSSKHAYNWVSKCRLECEYYRKRNSIFGASKSIGVLNYSYWLTLFGDMDPIYNTDEPSFLSDCECANTHNNDDGELDVDECEKERFGTSQKDSREVIICDEAHLIPSLAQQFFGVVIDFDQITLRLNRLVEWIDNTVAVYGDVESTSSSTTLTSLRNASKTISQYCIVWAKINSDSLKHLTDAHVTQLNNVITTINGTLVRTMSECLSSCPTFNHHKGKQDDDNKIIKRVISDVEFLNRVVSSTRMYVRTLKDPQHIVYTKNVKVDRGGHSNSLIPQPDRIEHIFRNIHDVDAIRDNILNKGRFFIFMSASIIDSSRFVKDMGLRGVGSYIKMHNPFTYEKSPIVYDKTLRLNYTNIKNGDVLNQAVNKLKIILDNHPKQRGIIHTGSYYIAKTIFELLPPKYKRRLILYSDSSEKQTTIDNVLSNRCDDDAFIVGPSLTTGIDLPGDFCKVIVVVKMPYKSLGDLFNKRKSEHDPQWYGAMCVDELVQSLGRGIRYPGIPERGIEEDSCSSYIIDGSLDNLFRTASLSFPQEFFSRLKITTIEQHFKR